ncbi:MAG: tyrosine-type recombinase/integrase [Silvibacterium sp.]
MRKARSQTGSLSLSVNGSGVQVWNFRWWETLPDGKRVRRRRQVGTLDRYRTEAAAERVVRSWRLAVNSNQVRLFSGITMKDVIDHFRMKELADKGEQGRAWSTRNRYASYLSAWIEPRWGKEELAAIKTPLVEEWLGELMQKPRKRKEKQATKQEEKELKPLAPGSKSKIRNLMSVLFNHAIRWEFTDRNPITGPTKGSGVRQSSKRQSIPDILEVSEMQAIVAELQLRESVLLFLDMVTGLRRGELAGLKWEDIDFENLQIDVNKSVVSQVVGRCKTEASQKPVPLDEYTAQALLAWYRLTPYRQPSDWVFASNSARAGKKRGKQPLWLSSIMRYHIQPVVKRLGINKRVAWHTFRRTYTTLLHANGEDVKVVQELLRHSSSRITLDIYAQAQMPAKRAAQHKVVQMVRPEFRPEMVEKGA